MADDDPDFSLLPPHVIFNVLKYLDIEEFSNAVLTCKSWYYASCDPRLIRRLEQSIAPDSPTQIDISYFVRPFSKLIIHSIVINHFKYRVFLSKFGYFIEELNFCMPIWRLTQIYDMLAYLPNLKILRIDDCNDLISTKNFWHFKRLKRLRNTILRHLRGIKELRLAVHYKEFEGINQILNYVNVETLWFQEDGLGQDYRDVLMNYILKGLKRDWNTENLRHLVINNLQERDTITFFCEMAYIDHLQLESLDIREISPHFHNYYFKEFCKNFRRLKMLHMKSTNENQLIDICNYIQFLVELDLENFEQLNVGVILQLKCLRNLRLCSNMLQRYDDLLAQPLEHLTQLSVHNISYKNLVQIGANYKNLRELVLFNVKTHDCMPIFQNLKKLRLLELDFEERQTLNSKFIESSEEFNITNLKELEQLEINCFVPGITLDLIKKITQLTADRYQYMDYSIDEENNSEESETGPADDEQVQQVNENIREEETESISEKMDDEEFEVYGDCEWFINMICDSY